MVALVQRAAGRWASVSVVFAVTMVAAAAAACDGSLTLRPAFFDALATSVAPAVTAAFSGHTFPQKTNEPDPGACDRVTLREGRWVTNVDFAPPGQPTVVLRAASASALGVVYPNVTVRNRKGNRLMNWTAQKPSVIGDPTVAGDSYATCFQVCLGYAPFTSSTQFSTEATFAAVVGKPLAVDVTSANVVTPAGGWVIDALNSSCNVNDQSTFDSLFNEGMGSAVSDLATPVTGSFRQLLQSVMANTTTSGFSAVALNSSGVFLAAATTAGPPMSGFNVPALTAPPAIEAVVALDVGTPATSALCVAQQHPCGATVRGATSQHQFTSCAACLQSQGSGTYIAFAASLSVGDEDQAPPSQSKATTRRPRRRGQQHKRSTVPGHVFNVPAKTTTSAVRNSDSIGMRTMSNEWLESAFVSKRLVTATAALAIPTLLALLNNYSVAGTSGIAPLPLAERYCGVAHPDVRWNVPESLTPTVKTITSDGSSLSVTVTIPQLASLSADIAFGLHCAVDLPFGTPFSHGVSGAFSVVMVPSSGSYDVVLSVDENARVSVAAHPGLDFNASWAYKKVGMVTVFQDYVQQYFVGAIGSTIKEQTTELLRTSFTAAWVNPVQALFAQTPSVAAVASSANLGGAAALYSGSASESSPSLNALLPAASPNARANIAVIANLGAAPPFNATYCQRSPTCSAAVSSSSVGATMQLQSCDACVEVVNGTTFIGARSVYTFSSTMASARHHHHRHDHHKRRKPPRPHRLARHAKPARSRFEAKAAPAAASDSTTSAFYLGTSAVTRALASVNSDILDALERFAVPAVNQIGLPYLDACSMTHEDMPWTDLPAITARVSEISDTGGADGLSLTVELVGLPQVLHAQTSFSVNCTVGKAVSPLPWTYAAQGRANVSLEFAHANPTVTLFVWSNSSTAGKVRVAPNGGTAFSVTGAHKLSTGSEGFVFTPFVAGYFATTVPSQFQIAMTNLVTSTIWPTLASAVHSITDSFAVSCPPTRFGSTHVLLASGPCDAALPEAPSTLPSDVMYYVIDAGPVPTGVLQLQGSQRDRLSTCTGLVPLSSPVSASIGLVNCSTGFTAPRDRVFVNVSAFMEF